MVLSCSAFNCSKRWGALKEDGTKLQFHRFPLQKPELLSKWIVAVRRHNFIPTKASFLCGNHFSEEDYKLPARRYLKIDAVPSIFDFPSHLKTVKKKRPLPIQHPLPIRPVGKSPTRPRGKSPSRPQRKSLPNFPEQDACQTQKQFKQGCFVVENYFMTSTNSIYRKLKFIESPSQISDGEAIQKAAQPQQIAPVVGNPLPLILSASSINSLPEKEVQMKSPSSVSPIQTETLFKESEAIVENTLPSNSSAEFTNFQLKKKVKVMPSSRVSKDSTIHTAKLESDVQDLLSLISSVSCTDLELEKGLGKKSKLPVSKQESLAFPTDRLIEQSVLTMQSSLASNSLVLSTVSQLKKMLEDAEEAITKYRRKINCLQQSKRRQSNQIIKLKRRIEELKSHNRIEESSLTSSEDSDDLTFNESAVDGIITPEQSASNEVIAPTQPMVIKLSSGIEP